MQRTLFFVLPAFALVSCGTSSDSSESSKKDVYAGYWLTYTASTGKLDTFAQFKDNGPKGATVQLPTNSKVLVNGSKMELKTGGETFPGMEGQFYLAETQSVQKVDPAFTFEWKREDGSVIKNTVPMAQQLSPEVPLAENRQHSRTDALQVAFEGEKNKPEESILCRLVSKSDTSKQIVLIEKLNKIQTCIFNAATLAAFPLGSAELTLTREWRSTKVVGHEKKGGFLSSEFVSVPVSLEVVP